MNYWGIGGGAFWDQREGFWRDWGFFNGYYCECSSFFVKCFRNSTKSSICFPTTSQSSLERSQSISSSNKSNKIPLILINFISKISSLSYIISKRDNQGSFLCSKTYFMLPDFLWKFIQKTNKSDQSKYQSIQKFTKKKLFIHFKNMWNIYDWYKSCRCDIYSSNVKRNKKCWKYKNRAKKRALRIWLVF